MNIAGYDFSYPNSFSNLWRILYNLVVLFDYTALIFKCKPFEVWPCLNQHLVLCCNSLVNIIELINKECICIYNYVHSTCQPITLFIALITLKFVPGQNKILNNYFSSSNFGSVLGIKMNSKKAWALTGLFTDVSQAFFQ